MARRKKESIRVDFSNIGKPFKANEEYAVEIVEASLEQGQKAPYFRLKLGGVDDEYKNSFMYHNASTSPESLWRLAPLLEAFSMDIPDGPMDLSVSDFVGKRAMCSTFIDRYDGGSSIKPDEFWEFDGESNEGESDFDLDALDDDDIKKLAEAAGIKGRSVAKLKAALEELDEDDLEEAKEKAGIEMEDIEFSLDNLDDDDIKKLAKELEIKGRVVNKLRKQLEEIDEQELVEAAENAGIDLDSEEDASGEISAEDINEMSEDELQELIDEHDLEVDLEDHKTLRKKKSAVVDAMEEAELLAD